MAKAIDQATVAVVKGKSLSEALRETDIFPDMACDPLAVAEETGMVAETLTTLGAFHGESLDVLSLQVATLLEPFMIAAVGGVVGFIMFALFIPMLDLTSVRIR